jgi:hypothetical protein
VGAGGLDDAALRRWSMHDDGESPKHHDNPEGLSRILRPESGIIARQPFINSHLEIDHAIHD